MNITSEYTLKKNKRMCCNSGIELNLAISQWITKFFTQKIWNLNSFTFKSNTTLHYIKKKYRLVVLQICISNK